MTFLCLSAACQSRKLCFSFLLFVFTLANAFLEPSCLHFLFHHCTATQSSLAGVRQSGGFDIFSTWLHLVHMMHSCPQDVTVNLTSLQTLSKYVRKHFTSHERILGCSQESRRIFLFWWWWGLDCATDCSSIWRTALWAEITMDWACSLVFHLEKAAFFYGNLKGIYLGHYFLCSLHDTPQLHICNHWT